jgi:hypothetical protein
MLEVRQGMTDLRFRRLEVGPFFHTRGGIGIGLSGHRRWQLDSIGHGLLQQPAGIPLRPDLRVIPPWSLDSINNVIIWRHG